MLENAVFTPLIGYSRAAYAAFRTTLKRVVHPAETVRGDAGRGRAGEKPSASVHAPAGARSCYVALQARQCAPRSHVSHDSIDPAVLDQVSQVFARARSVLFITGAGISADSGLPTYRGIGGLYDDAATEEGFEIEDALSGNMLRQRPEVCWK